MDQRSIDLDVSKSEKKVWLVKVPDFVASRWHAACEHSANGNSALGQELGKVKVEVDPATAQTRCTLELIGDTEGIPTEYNMRQAPGDASCIYSFGEEPGLVSVNGRVQQRFDVEMRQGQAGQTAVELDPNYRKLSRERNLAASMKTRTAQVIDPQSVARQSGLRSGTVQVTGKAYAAMAPAKRRWDQGKERRMADKRVRMDKDALESLLFKLFERKDFWKFPDIVKEADQPVAWLKECLLEIAVQNKTPGLTKDQWQLKREYRTRAS